MAEKTQEEILEEIREYANEMAKPQKCFLTFIDDISNEDNNYEILIQSINQNKITEDNHKMREFLHLVSEVSSNHYRGPNFFSKIEKFIKRIRNEITKNIPNDDIFNIFRFNNRILLFLFKEKIITPSITLITQLINYENSEEIKKCFVIRNDPKLSREENNKITINEEIIQEEIQKYGENDDKICKIIRNDSLEELISSKVSINLTFEPSIYETNQFLKDKTPSIIEYSAFYGSVKIFKYAIDKNAELSNTLWLFAIHGRNMEIIQELENRYVDPPYRSYEDPAVEMIKCHHNELYELIVDDRLNNEPMNYDDQNLCYLHLFQKSFESYNFEMIYRRFDINFEENKQDIFPEICRNDNYYIIQKILGIQDIDINAQTVSNIKNVFIMFF